MYMKNIKPFLYVVGTALLPVFALAHGEVDDGHVEAVVAPNPEQRTTVIIVIAVVFVLMGIFVWYSRRNNTPAVLASEKKDEVTPA
jgi:heme/copper-type cytochrome/quinol oxidase subunit 2